MGGRRPRRRLGAASGRRAGPGHARGRCPEGRRGSESGHRTKQITSGCCSDHNRPIWSGIGALAGGDRSTRLQRPISSSSRRSCSTAGTLAYPLVYSAILSLYETNPATLVDSFVGLRNYADLFASDRFLFAMVRTAFYALTSSFAALVIGLVVALCIHHLDFRYKSLLLGLLFVPWVMSPVEVALIGKWMVHPIFGPLNHALVSAGRHPAQHFAPRPAGHRSRHDHGRLHLEARPLRDGRPLRRAADASEGDLRGRPPRWRGQLRALLAPYPAAASADPGDELSPHRHLAIRVLRRVRRHDGRRPARFHRGLEHLHRRPLRAPPLRGIGDRRGGALRAGGGAHRRLPAHRVPQAEGEVDLAPEPDHQERAADAGDPVLPVHGAVSLRLEPVDVVQAGERVSSARP